MSGIEKCFDGFWNNLLHKFRWVIIGVILVWSLVSAGFTSQLGPLTEQEEFLPADHPAMLAINLSRDTFYSGASDVAIYIQIYWGIDSIDKSSIPSWDATAIGEIVWDDSMDISPVEN